jgi:hypothetical protein
MQEGKDYTEFDPEKKDLKLDEKLMVEYVDMLKEITNGFVSLNKHNLPMPDLMNVILGATLAFAAENIAVIVDQVKVDCQKNFIDKAEETFSMYMDRLKSMVGVA